MTETNGEFPIIGPIKAYLAFGILEFALPRINRDDPDEERGMAKWVAKVNLN